MNPRASIKNLKRPEESKQPGSKARGAADNGIPPMTADQRQQVTDLVEEKMQSFQYEIQNMVNNFHIEIIR